MPIERPPIPNSGHDGQAREQTLLPPIEGRSSDGPFKTPETPIAKIRLVLDRIDGIFLDLTTEERLHAVSRVMEHSLSDGLDLMRHVHKKYGNDVDTGPPLIAVLKKSRSEDVPQNRIALKHRRVFAIVQERLKQLKRSGDAYVDAGRLEEVEQLISDERSNIESNAGRKDVSERAKAMLEDIDAAYAELIRLHRPKRLRTKETHEKSPDIPETVLRDGESFAARIIETSEGRYETDTAYRLLEAFLRSKGIDEGRIRRLRAEFDEMPSWERIRKQAIPMPDLFAASEALYSAGISEKVFPETLEAFLATARFKMPAELFFTERRSILRRAEKAMERSGERLRPRLVIERIPDIETPVDFVAVDGSGQILLTSPLDYGEEENRSRYSVLDRNKKVIVEGKSRLLAFSASTGSWFLESKFDKSGQKSAFFIKDGSIAKTVKIPFAYAQRSYADIQIVEDDLRINEPSPSPGKGRVRFFSAMREREIEISARFSEDSEKTASIEGAEYTLQKSGPPPNGGILDRHGRRIADIYGDWASDGRRLAFNETVGDDQVRTRSLPSGDPIFEQPFGVTETSSPFFFGHEIRAFRIDRDGIETMCLTEREGGKNPIVSATFEEGELCVFHDTSHGPIAAIGRHSGYTLVGPDGVGRNIPGSYLDNERYGLVVYALDHAGDRTGISVIRIQPPEQTSKNQNSIHGRLERLHAALENLDPSELEKVSRGRHADGATEAKRLPTNSGDLLSRMAQDAPELYLKSNPAVPDDDPEFLAERLVEAFFPAPDATPPPPPDIPKTSAVRRLLNSVLGVFNPSKATAVDAHRTVETPRTPRASAYLNPYAGAEIAGGSGRKERNASETIVECRDSFEGFVTSSLNGAYNRETDRWETTVRPDRSHAPAHRVLTWAIPLTEWQPSIVLPLPPDAQLLPERIVAVIGKRQVPISKIGPGDTVELPPGTERVLYSFGLPEPEPMAEPTDAELAQWKRKHLAEYPETAALLDVPGKIPPAISWLLQSPEFKKLAPKKKVERIEAYVREISTYDTRNDDVSKRKEGVPLERQWAVAMERAKTLDPNKPFAGVCADTAKLACALLRSAGFFAGVQQGFAAKGKTLSTQNAHATAFVLWPDADGKARIVTVDGTPPSTDPQAAEHPLAQIADREAQEIASAHETEKTFAQAVFAETKDALQAGNPEALKELRNGKLEAALNAILAHEVRPSDLASVQALFGALRYSPLRQLDISDPAQRHHLQEELVEILDRQRRFKNDAKSGARPGQALFEEIRRFVAWNAKDPHLAAPGAALAHVEQVVALAKTGFNATERRALAASLLYLKAERMLGGKR